MTLDELYKENYIQIEWRAFAAAVQVVVKDNRSGIQPEDVHHIFKLGYTDVLKVPIL